MLVRNSFNLGFLNYADFQGDWHQVVLNNAQFRPVLRIFYAIHYFA